MGAIQPLSVHDFHNAFLVPEGAKITLQDKDPDHKAGFEKGTAKKIFKRNKEEIGALQKLLYASKERGLLIVLQGMDTAGKDGTIRHVLEDVEQGSCNVASFQAPTKEERSHNFLWRIAKHVPAKGNIGVFHRSHYEDVLVPKVKDLVSEETINERYEQINDFERMLSENGITILKFFLYISNEEQKERLSERISDRTKQWKLNPADFEERKYWDDYMEAYEGLLSNCSTEWAPWYVIPANYKWFRNLVISQIILETLEKMDLEYPPPAFDISTIDID